jgi:protein-ribulosamine 3-kinase
MLSDVPQPIQRTIKAILNVELKTFSFTGGGCINHGGELETSQDTYFLKWNDQKKFPNMFSVETRGLQLLRDSKTVFIPHVILAEHAGDYQFILLEFVNPSSKSKKFWTILGEQLSQLHKIQSTTFGLDHDNYIGSLPQHNSPQNDWVSFFVHQRLGAQIKIAVDKKLLDNTTIDRFDKLIAKLPSLLPECQPSLLHGDLWSGNVITSAEGFPCLIDPAVYFGHREIEVAFTKLFGGFPMEFYKAYDSCYPLEEKFETRIDLYNLYPLLVHANLFGGGYVSQVISVLRRFV